MKDQAKELTREELEKQLADSRAKMQNDFIDKVIEDLNILLSRVNRTDYKCTEYEFLKIRRELSDLTKSIIELAE